MPRLEIFTILTYSSEFDVMNDTATLFAIRALVDKEATSQISAKKQRAEHHPRRRANESLVTDCRLVTADCFFVCFSLLSRMWCLPRACVVCCCAIFVVS